MNPYRQVLDMGFKRLFGDKLERLFELCRTFGVQRLEVFGSAVDESFDPARSDIDFLVTFSPCTPAERYDRYFGLLESLESLFDRRVDLFESQALRNPYFIRQVRDSKRLLYAA